MPNLQLSANLNVGAANAGARVPEVIVFEHEKFNTNPGDEGALLFRTVLAVSFIGDNFNDKVSSIIVVSGTWRFFEHANFQGNSWTLGPGYYPNLAPGMCNDCISSFEPVAF